VDRTSAAAVTLAAQKIAARISATLSAMNAASLLLLCLTRAQDGPPRLEHVATIPASAPGSEIISIQAATRRAAVTHGRTGQIELFDLSDPAKPRTVKLFDLVLEKGEDITSVALPPSGDWFLVVVKAGKKLGTGRALLHSLADGSRLASFPCGVGPDSVKISADGKQALVANEAEGFDSVAKRLVSAPGSLTHIRFAEELARSQVTQIAFERAASGSTDERLLERDIDDEAREIPLENGPEYLEPEVAIFLPDGLRALVSLQENNQVAYVDLAADKVDHLLALGNVSHPADLVNDGRFQETGTLLARREPDGLALTPDGRFFLTADEGQTVPNVEKTPPGKPAAGGRTLSVFDLATGKLAGDTGPQLDRMAAQAGLYPDKRSSKKGCEPEMVLTFERAGTPYAALTLERAGALALVDLRDPSKPTVIAVVACGGDPLKDEPEGLAHFRDPASQADYLYVANEGSGTLGVLRVPH